MTDADKLKAKAVAIKEVNSRIVTKEQAKESFNNWINTALKHNAKFSSKDIIDFWNEVKKQVELL